MEGGGEIRRCNVKNNKQNQEISTSLLLSTITPQVVLKITQSSVILEVASKVEIVAWTEVPVSDSIDVIRVTDTCDVGLAPIGQFFPQGLMGGASSMVQWPMAVCFSLCCCVLWCGGCVVSAGMINATVMSCLCSLDQMYARVSLT